MRYNNIDTIVFTDSNGVDYSVKDLRPIKTFETGMKVKTARKFDVDELVSRKEFYGDDAEDLAFAVVDHNAVKFAEADFDTGGIKEIDMPIIEEIL